MEGGKEFLFGMRLELIAHETPEQRAHSHTTPKVRDKTVYLQLNAFLFEPGSDAGALTIVFSLRAAFDWESPPPRSQDCGSPRFMPTWAANTNAPRNSAPPIHITFHRPHHHKPIPVFANVQSTVSNVLLYVAIVSHTHLVNKPGQQVKPQQNNVAKGRHLLMEEAWMCALWVGCNRMHSVLMDNQWPPKQALHWWYAAIQRSPVVFLWDCPIAMNESER